MKMESGMKARQEARTRRGASQQCVKAMVRGGDVEAKAW